jgi:hypothetical protein
MVFSEGVTRFVLPVFLSVLAALVAKVAEAIYTAAENKRNNRAMQIEESTALTKTIVHDADHLYSFMYNRATPIVWRRIAYKKDGISLPAKDDDHWAEYELAIDKWRCHGVTYETQLLGFFGFGGMESAFFKALNLRFIRIADILEEAYLYNSDVSSASFDVVMSQEEFNLLYSEVRTLIAALSSTMINCIMHKYVGNLREGVKEPTPSPELVASLTDAIRIVETELMGKEKKEIVHDLDISYGSVGKAKKEIVHDLDSAYIRVADGKGN